MSLKKNPLLRSRHLNTGVARVISYVTIPVALISPYTGHALTDAGWQNHEAPAGAPAAPTIDMLVGLIVDSKLPVGMFVPERGRPPAHSRP